MGAVQRAAAGAELPDPTWIALIAAFLSVCLVDPGVRKSMRSDLARHAPSLNGFRRRVSPSKAYAEAEADGLDPKLFCRAMLAVAPGQTLSFALRKLSAEEAFDAISFLGAVELRLAGSRLPPGLGQLRNLDRLTLLDSQKLRTDGNVSELAALGRPIWLTLDFDGVPQTFEPAPAFLPPRLDLLAAGGFNGLGFGTTGYSVRISLDDLAPLRAWSRLERLSLRYTTLSKMSLQELSQLKAHAPQLRMLLLERIPDGWEGEPDGLRIRVDDRPFTNPWSHH